MIKIRICRGKACTNAGTQNKVRTWLLSYFSKEEIAETNCLGLCHNNFAVWYNGKAYSIVSAKTLKRIITSSGAS